MYWHRVRVSSSKINVKPCDLYVQMCCHNCIFYFLILILELDWYRASINQTMPFRTLILRRI